VYRSTSVQSYRESEILTAPPGRLLVITFDALIAAMTRARVGITMQDATVSAAGFDRARGLLGELLVTLDRKAGGDLAERLAAIYVFMLQELDALALRANATRLERHIGMVRDLRDAFAQIAGEPSALAS
jgi:flagellar protein FliS